MLPGSTPGDTRADFAIAIAILTGPLLSPMSHVVADPQKTQHPQKIHRKLGTAVTLDKSLYFTAVVSSVESRGPPYLLRKPSLLLDFRPHRGFGLLDQRVGDGDD